MRMTSAAGLNHKKTTPQDKIMTRKGEVQETSKEASKINCRDFYENQLETAQNTNKHLISGTPSWII